LSDCLFVRGGRVSPELLSGLNGLSACAPSAGFGILLVTPDGISHRFANDHMPQPQSSGGDFPSGRVIAAMVNGDYFLRVEVLVNSDEADGLTAVTEAERMSRAVDFLSEIETLAAAWLVAGSIDETRAYALSNVV